MKKLLLLLALFSGGWASAQAVCPPLQLQAFHNSQQIRLAGHALPSAVTLVITNDPSCTPVIFYQVKKAQMTLIRSKRPILPARTIQGAEVDLTDFAKFAQPGDRLYIEVMDMLATPAGGQPKPYHLADSRTIALNWLITK